MPSTAANRVVATRVAATPDMLGESPLWDDRIGRLYWVDGVARLIRWHEPATGALGQVETPSTVGSIGLCADGTLVAGLFDGIWRIAPATGAAEPLWRPDPVNQRMRFNDGKVDRQGRFVCGGMGIYAEPVGELVRVGADGTAQVLANGIRISNALCFSPDGRTMYFADSLDRFIRAYDYGDGALANPRVFADTQQFNSGPDGATVDAEGFVWVALVNVGKIARFAPSGKLDRMVEAPTDMPSCVAFGGPDLTTLYVTSIKDSGSGRAISRHPQGGHLFAIEGLGVTGLPEPRMGIAHG
jgi:L-arabinonolactonase